MTYPPQQPGPYGPLQGPYGQPGPYGQQPYGYGQQPGYGPQGPGGYGQMPGAFGGFPPPYPPPRKSNTGLIIGIVLAAVVVLGGGVGAYALFAGGGASGRSASNTSSDPDSVARAIVDAMNSQNRSGYQSLACASSAPVTGLPSRPNLPPMRATFTLTGKAQVNGDTATAPVHMEATVSGQGVNGNLQLTLSRRNGGWCMAALTPRSLDMSSPGGGYPTY